MGAILRLLRALPLLILSPVALAAAVTALAAADLAWLAAGRRRRPSDTRPSIAAASIVIPSWNTCDLLEKYLPSVIAAADRNPGSEVIVVDNGSEDASAEVVREKFPRVRVVALERNLGFGGGSNAGFRAARHDIVILLNSDMRVDPDFINPLLLGFQDERVFAVACQIFFSDPNRTREETGLTEGWWENGGLRVRHRADEKVTGPFPCFYGGGGSCAFDRRKFLELGGFDAVLEPFYFEDTDLGYMAWKRGWRVLYQPASIVYHEHRGTIGRRFKPAFIQAVLKKNALLFAWKNIHEWRRLAAHFFFTAANAALGAFVGDSPERASLGGLFRACLQLPGAVRGRWRARSLSVVGDTEAFRRTLGGYHRDRFLEFSPDPSRLRVLFVSPYPICPPVHGGAVFMYQTLSVLTRLCDVHLVALVDEPEEIEAHQDLTRQCASAEFVVRMEAREPALGSIVPHAVREFSHRDLGWLIRRQIESQDVDVVQLEYTPMAQYAGGFLHLPCVLFEHDIYFQSVGRGLGQARGAVRKIQSAFEYLRALRWELGALRRPDRIQVCSRQNKEFLLSFLPSLAGRIDDGLRAGIDVPRYPFRTEGREPLTMLFLGSFRHLPNQEALDWFSRRVFPLVVEQEPEARLVVVGSDPPPRHSLPDTGRVELVGYVDDVRDALARYAVFVCPVLSGSGVRVKLLEAFAAGIPVVSTRIGAEGLTESDGELCALADEPSEFAGRIVGVLREPEQSAQMALRARHAVEQNWDIARMTAKLVDSYRAVVEARLKNASRGAPAVY